jgi:DNA-binding transcriptional ArsR family regulator
LSKTRYEFSTDSKPDSLFLDTDFTLPGVSINLRILKEAGLIPEKKEGKNKLYSLNRKTTSELVRFFDDMYDYELKSLKEYAENKKKRK